MLSRGVTPVRYVSQATDRQLSVRGLERLCTRTRSGACSLTPLSAGKMPERATGTC